MNRMHKLLTSSLPLALGLLYAPYARADIRPQLLPGADSTAGAPVMIISIGAALLISAAVAGIVVVRRMKR
jgi:hypothetical protein